MPTKDFSCYWSNPAFCHIPGTDIIPLRFLINSYGSYDCPNLHKMSLMDMGKINHCQIKTKHNQLLTTTCIMGCVEHTYPDSKVHGVYMGPIWGRQDPGGPPCWSHEPWYLGMSPLQWQHININATWLLNDPLWGKSTGDWWIHLTKGQSCRKSFYVMTSSCDVIKRQDSV